MRKSISILTELLTLATVSLSAQINEGIITYTRTVKFKYQGPPQFQPPGSGGEQVKKQNLELLFSGKQSLLRNIAEQTEQPEEEGPVVIRVIGPGSDQLEVFTDLTAKKSSSLRDLGSKEYVVDDTLKHENWKLTTETKNILGYTCHKATAERITWRKQMMMMGDTPKIDSILDTIQYVAWYADGFGCNSGPEAAGALPGMILEYDVDNGRLHILATSVATSVKKKEIVPPKGKHITAAEYKALEADFRRKMMEQRGMPPPRN
ncbi:MAG: GLPGLI family protein [Bacteroidia bacterium]